MAQLGTDETTASQSRVPREAVAFVSSWTTKDQVANGPDLAGGCCARDRCARREFLQLEGRRIFDPNERLPGAARAPQQPPGTPRLGSNERAALHVWLAGYAACRCGHPPMAC